MLVPLAAVIAEELARVDVPGHAHRGQALPALPLPWRSCRWPWSMVTAPAS
jgi:hypothetical protein